MLCNMCTLTNRVLLLATVFICLAHAAPPDPAKEKAMKADLVGQVESMKTQAQVMVDTIFSFAELGFQEYETSKYLTDMLEHEGFKIERGIAGIPTAWMATWGSGKPVISLGSDIDCIPQASQKPAVAYHDPMIEGAPGHGEGHNSGQVVNIVAALSIKRLMEREHIPGTIKIWPGVAEELLGSKAYYVRAGYFKDVDVTLFSHVGNNLGVNWGDGKFSGLVSVEYMFKGESAHSAGAPWRGRSALDAVELMDAGWNFRREHLRLQQRSHYVITNGGDQPNVVPSEAAVWYYFRELDYPHIKELYDLGNTMAQAATMMTGTTVDHRLVGSAWPRHFNKVIAEAQQKNIEQVGMPQWSEADQTLAKALQKEIGAKVEGLKDKVKPLEPPVKDPIGGASDDVGDISWNVPMVYMLYPANIPNLPGHSWANGVSMATPIAHKGSTAGAKVQAMTALDFLLKPELVKEAWEYFRAVQTKDVHYESFLAPDDKPAIELNKEKMEKFLPELRKYYFDPSRYKTYLEQLGIQYPTVRKEK